jgi:hypothetical protein
VFDVWAFGATCSDALGSVAASSIVGSLWPTVGATCSLVALAPAVAGFPLVASSLGTSVDAELQFDKTQLMLHIIICLYY